MSFIAKASLSFSLILLSISAFSQGLVKGTIKSSASGETLIGASVTYAPGKGATTDLDGNFSLSVPDGEYEITVSYVGFSPKIQIVKVAGKPILLNFSLETTELQVVEVVADVARTRETPVAFTNISGVKIQEEAAGRDLPMMLNSTPGVYATEQGGGMGDSRVNIRGFDQRNVAVMVDGVPVNDMENGQVFWSNWDNLGDVTRTMQVQRGLGASKLAIPSVGGTINIMTKGIDSKKGGYVKQEIGNVGMTRPLHGFSEGVFKGSNVSLIQQSKTSFGYNSGRLKGGWGITFAGSYRRGEGYVQQADYEAWGYFIKIQKEFKNQLLTFSVSGAPQVHGQRTTRLPIAVYNTKMAENMGIPVDSILNNSPNPSTTTNSAANYSNSAIGDRGARFNPAWGYYYDKDSVKRKINPSQNYYHKPQFNLSHFWSPNSKFTWSNVAYLSIGSGGGEAFTSTSTFVRDSATGNFDFTKSYQQNHSYIDKTYDSLLTQSNRIIRASVNDHFWYGLLSTLNYSPTKSLNIMGGIDLRSYKGTHYQEVRNLFGGDYVVDKSDELSPKPLVPGDPNFASRMKKVGDKFNYHNSGIIRWLGSFLQAEYKKGKFTVFANGSVSYTGYKRVDYFRKKDLVLSDTTVEESLGWGDTLAHYNGHVYKADTFRKYFPTIPLSSTELYNKDSKEARYNTQDWKWFTGYTIKVGSNYNIDEHHNIFINAGLLSIAPRYSQFYTNNSNQGFPDVKQQYIKAVEIGYGFKLKRHAFNVNGYYTYWENKPPSNQATLNYENELYSYVLQGINTQSIGVEFDATGYILKRLQYEAAFSLGDWKYTGSGTAYLYDQGTEKLKFTLYPNTTNVHTGDAAQVQASASLRYEPFKGFYLKGKVNYFGKNYATFDPLTLLPVYDNGVQVGDNGGRDSWQIPDYYFIELHAGYSWKAWKLAFNLNASVVNLTDNNYISDAQNGIKFDATTATVYVAQGRRYTLGLKIAF